MDSKTIRALRLKKDDRGNVWLLADAALFPTPLLEGYGFRHLTEGLIRSEILIADMSNPKSIGIFDLQYRHRIAEIGFKERQDD